MKAKKANTEALCRLNARKRRRHRKTKKSYMGLVILIVILLVFMVVIVKVLSTPKDDQHPVKHVPKSRSTRNNEPQTIYPMKDEIQRNAEKDDDEDDNNNMINDKNDINDGANTLTDQDNDDNNENDDWDTGKRIDKKDTLTDKDENNEDNENEHVQKYGHLVNTEEYESKRKIVYSANNTLNGIPESDPRTSFKVLFFLDDSPGLSSSRRKGVGANAEERPQKSLKPIVEELIKEELRDSNFFYFYQLYKKFTQVFTPQEVQPFVWGTDFADYDSSLSMPENIKRKYPRKSFDFVLTKSSFSSSALGSIRGNNSIPIAVMYEDCVINERIPSQDPDDVFVCNHVDTGDLFFHSYANSMAYYAKYGYGSLLWHLPHAVDPAYFYPAKKHSERTTDILIVGSDWTFYPLRFKVLRMADDDKLPGVVKRYINYPVATLSDGLMTPEKRYRDLEVAYRDYIAALKDAKIVVVCSGKRNNANRLYVEAAAAGALVVGNIPEEREDDFRSWMVEVSQTSSVASLYHTLKWWLDNEQARSKRAEMGMKHVIKEYGLKRASIDVVYAMQSYILGQRGAVFRHRFGEVDHFLPKNVICAKSLTQIDKLLPKTNDKK